MAHRYRVLVQHNGEQVQVYPQHREAGTHFQEACTRIGMMVMSEQIERIEVYRDDGLYRSIEVQGDSTTMREQKVHNPITRATVTVEQVRAIRGRYAEGSATMDELASEYRVSRSQICNIINRKIWKNVEGGA